MWYPWYCAGKLNYYTAQINTTMVKKSCIDCFYNDAHQKDL
jgi:hypothetical protein